MCRPRAREHSQHLHVDIHEYVDSHRDDQRSGSTGRQSNHDNSILVGHQHEHDHANADDHGDNHATCAG